MTDRRKLLRVFLPMAEVVDLYVNKKWATDRIGERFGCSMPTVLARLRAAGVQIRHHNDTKRGAIAHNRKPLALGDSEIVALYLSSPEVTRRELCLLLECTMRRLNAILRSQNIPFKPYRLVIGNKKSGPNSPQWNPSLSLEDRERLRKEDFRTVHWRKAVYERDGFKCVRCDDNSGGNLNAHHLESYNSCRELRWEVTNGATLCESCHVTFHKRFGFGDNTAAQFNEYMNCERIAA